MTRYSRSLIEKSLFAVAVLGTAYFITAPRPISAPRPHAASSAAPHVLPGDIMTWSCDEGCCEFFWKLSDADAFVQDKRTVQECVQRRQVELAVQGSKHRLEDDSSYGGKQNLYIIRFSLCSLHP